MNKGLNQPRFPYHYSKQVMPVVVIYGRFIGGVRGFCTIGDSVSPERRSSQLRQTTQDSPENRGLMVPETDDPKEDPRANPSRVVLFKGPKGLVTKEAIIGQLQSHCLDNEYQSIVEVKDSHLEDPFKGITAVYGQDPMEVGVRHPTWEDYAKEDQTWVFNDRAYMRASEWELSGGPPFYEIPAKPSTTASEPASETVCGSDTYNDKSRVEDAWTIVKPVACKSSKKPRVTAARPKAENKGSKDIGPRTPACCVM
ncbi:hypothetical protein QBC37DRAFT_401448 [Rhypophila decipiens]|uniref:Uncharacterized protein n=1 Tax=Rhypophila decipiens TaxID=261697 RepID=A0AAN6Y626_9PEZI|nr:hypothetical protein QBC37DRAFT_401448 [Rhypophila decipiens]